MPIVFLAIMAAASVPSAEAQQLGRKLASQGTIASLLPLMKTRQVEELIAEDKSLDSEEQAKLRAIADRVFDAEAARILAATGDAYARQLALADLRSLTRFNDTPAAARYRVAIPAVVMATIKSMGQLDFKGAVRTAFCAETKRLCTK